MRLQFTDEIIYFLEFASRDSIIAQILLQGDSKHLHNEGNYISLSDSESFSFLSSSKYEKVEDVWRQSRTKIKVGRFIRKFFTEFSITSFGIDDRQIEKFVNLYKSYFSRDITKLRVVEGAELRKLYLEENYHVSSSGFRGGTLWNSCMRQEERNRFLKLYEKNPEHIKMLVYFDEVGKVRARALLWQDVKQYNSENTYKVMDRIYYVYDHDVQFFKDWAKENGYISKWEQNAKSERYLDIDGPMKMDIYVQLPIHNLPYAPYLDTFKFYNAYKGVFSNTDRFSFDYVLIQSNGQYERDPEPEEMWEDEN